ncbi:MAG: DEAD/DEAH box helicase family protein [Bacteroidota bacterium]|nr:DEAD/DEAH box helicase family protein [Bacteroidota bacterium]
MKLHFDSNQSYQLKAVQSVIDLFEGQPLNKGDFEFSLSEDSGSLQLNENGFGNKLMLSEEQMLQNLKEVQKENDIETPLSFGEGPGVRLYHGMNFSLEMETGTGKTYVYLRTIYDLNKNYGFKKFVIVVPSIAIREGVLKNLEITHEHFQNLYDKAPSYYDVYDSSKVSSLRSFASSNNIQILVINIDSFAKDENVINKTNDKLTGKKPIEFIQSTNPIVIIDEPQNVETPIRKKAIDNLNPLCTLRYSATHTNLYNLIYRLDPVRAYDLGLVKQIEVDSIYTMHGNNQPFIFIESITHKPRLKVKLKIDFNSDKEVVKKGFSVKIGDDLYLLSNKREIYRDGFIINGIDSSNRSIEFSNGIVLNEGQEQGGFTDEIMKYQIKKTIQEHLKKEKEYKPLGIKVLSLFFIDRVSNYRSYDENGKVIQGKFAEWFEEIYHAEIKKPVFKELATFDVKDLHNGYFAQDKKGQFKDSSGETKADDDIYHLIMKDKERLLDINVPLRFIFSHSALREGWDNPNVFQICTLNETKSELKKRQEIGRGLRLAVNQSGERTFNKNINKLTVVANESYEDFAKQLQKEIQEECGVDFKGRIKNKEDRVEVTLKKNYQLDQKFLDLWEKIKYKTIYKVEYDTQNLIKEASEKIKSLDKISRPILVSEKAKIEIKKEGVSTITTGTNLPVEIEEKFRSIPDIIGYIQSKTELTRSTILKIIKESGRLNDILINPQLFLDNAVNEIKKVMDKLMINGIKYEKVAGRLYEMKLFESEEIESYKENLKLVQKQEKTLYNYIEFDSEIEKQFANDCENNENIEFYMKLPRWFIIETPIGKYIPDWALIFKDEKKLYFVAETKGSKDDDQLRVSEDMKIKYGVKHFREFEDIKFKKVESVSDLIH